MIDTKKGCSNGRPLKIAVKPQEPFAVEMKIVDALGTRRRRTPPFRTPLWVQTALAGLFLTGLVLGIWYILDRWLSE